MVSRADWRHTVQSSITGSLRHLLCLGLALLALVASSTRGAAEDRQRVYRADRFAYFAAYFEVANAEALPPDEEVDDLDGARKLASVLSACEAWARAVDIELLLAPDGHFRLTYANLPRIVKGTGLCDQRPKVIGVQTLTGRWSLESDVLELEWKVEGQTGEDAWKTIRGISRGERVLLPSLWDPFPVPGDEVLTLAK